jgi:hypothetical protein
MCAAMLVARADGVESPETSEYGPANNSIGLDTVPLPIALFEIVVYFMEEIVDPTVPTDKMLRDKHGMTYTVDPELVP